MVEHIRIENEKFYPKLDKQLSDSDRTKMLENIKNIYSEILDINKMKLEDNFENQRRFLKSGAYGLILGALLISSGCASAPPGMRPVTLHDDGFWNYFEHRALGIEYIEKDR